MLNLKENNYFDVITMPGGEPHIKWKNGDLKNLHINLLARLNSGNDVLELLVVTDALKRLGCKISVCVPYFCGARQDRISSYGESLTVKVYADLINSLGFEKVTIVDPHSEVTPALLNKCNILPVADILKRIVTEHNYDTILIPDAGATKRMFSYYFPDLEFNQKLNFVQCLKKRDTLTGKLSGFKIVDHVSDGTNCLIVDDICDGGGTFIGLANELAIVQPTVGKMGLYTTHGIYSKGIEPLLHSADNIDGVFDELFCTDSWKKPNLYGVKVYNLEY